jgi:hypothetical protein
MGQYHYVANLDKKEYVHPHRMGDGLKLLEFGSSGCGTMTGLALLLACSNGRGGGDLHSDHKVIGSWAGDRIAIIGDYAEAGDFPGFENADDSPWENDKGWKDISNEVRAAMSEDGYLNRELRSAW